MKLKYLLLFLSFLLPASVLSAEERKEPFTLNGKPVLYRASHIHIATIKSTGNAKDKASRKKAERLTKTINEEAEEKINSLLILTFSFQGRRNF